MPPEGPANRLTPEETLAAYAVALGTQNWEEVAPYIHPECTAVFSSGTYRGAASVEAIFRRNFDRVVDEKYRVENVQWLDLTDDRAVVLYDFAWSGVIEGRPASGGGRGTSVMAVHDGRWKILLEHLG